MVIRVHPGDGLVARAKGSVLVLLPPVPDHPLADELLALVEESASAPAPGRLLARRVARLVAGAEPGEVPSFGLVTQADEGLVLMLHGNADAQVSYSDGQEHLSGRQVATWVDRMFERPVDLLVIGPGDSPSITPDPRLRLGEGVVHGAGFSVAPAGVTEAPARVVDQSEIVAGVELPTPPGAPGAEDTNIVVPRSARTTLEPSPDPVVSGSFSSMVPPVAATHEAAEPLATSDGQPDSALVTGVVCPSGHLSDPTLASCGTCGAALDPESELVEGPRPALGVITFDDGSSVALEYGCVLGREPESDADVVSGRARPLVVDDPERTMSRVHATIALDGWTVLLTDRGAANGTYVSGPGQDGWAPLLPNQPTPLQRGSRVRLGDREFRFDAMTARH